MDTASIHSDHLATVPSEQSLDNQELVQSASVNLNQLQDSLVIKTPRDSKNENAQDPEATEKREAEKRKEERRARFKKSGSISFKSATETELKRPTVLNSLINDEMEHDTAITTPTHFSPKDRDDIETRSVDLTEKLEDVNQLVEYYSDEEAGSLTSALMEEPVVVADSVQLKTDFLDEFELPALSDISDEVEVVKRGGLSGQASTITMLDRGKFVDPLTGESVNATPSSTTSIPSLASLETQVLTEVKSDLSLLDFNDTLQRTSRGSFIKIEDDDDNLAQFQKAVKDYTAVEKEVLLPEVNAETQRIVNIFIHDIIKYAVLRVEKMPEFEKLSKMLNKEKLFADLKENYDDLCVSKDTNNYLNQKMVEHYRRQRILRAFARLTPALNQIEYERYMTALRSYDYYLKLNESVTEKTHECTKNVLDELGDALQVSKMLEQSLENRIIGSISKRSDNLAKTVKRELRLMRIYRDDIGDTRFHLITRKHTFGLISDKIHKLNQISENLTANDFIDLQNQVVLLGEKIDEKNTELKKMRALYHTNVHMSQHFRESSIASQEQLRLQWQRFDAADKRRQQLRKHLYEAKLERSKLKRQKQDLTYQGGLLTTPLLLYDYDETLEHTIDKRASIMEMKKTAKHLTHRISEIQKSSV